MNNADKPTFPVTHELSGLTKREYFAGLAMQGLRSGKLTVIPANSMSLSEIWSSKTIAKVAVEDADALLAELDKKQGNE